MIQRQRRAPPATDRRGLLARMFHHVPSESVEAPADPGWAGDWRPPACLRHVEGANPRTGPETLAHRRSQPGRGEIWGLVVLAGAALGVGGGLGAGCGEAGCPDEEVHVRWSGGELNVCAAVAQTGAERAAGLSTRPPLGDGEGLVLDFPLEGEVCLVNGGVPYAVDGIHVAEDGRVVGVTCGMPADDPTAHCVQDTRWVLEVASPVGCGVPVGASAAR